MAESLGAKAAGIDLGDDGTLTRSEKHMIFSRFYKKHCPGDKKKGGKIAVEALVKRHRGAKFIALCENMKRKYRESPLEMWEVLMGGAEDRKRDLDHELAVRCTVQATVPFPTRTPLTCRLLGHEGTLRDCFCVCVGAGVCV